MTKAKHLGIWMDHASAHMMDLATDPLETVTIETSFTNEERGSSLTKNENLMHNKEQHKQSEFYKKIMETIRNYDEVLLFGPTDAKAELHNIIKADHRFGKTKIEVKQAGKMSSHDQQIFVKAHFSKHEA
jgi:stalled ribosome rescue protein Dom34